MPNENWVGFAKSPKPDPDLTKLVVSAEVEFSAPIASVFGLVTDAQGLSSWLHKVDKSEVRTSGKITLANVAAEFEQSVFSLVELGRKVVINSELFGELIVTFDKRGSKLEISFTKLVSAASRVSETQNFETLLERFKARVGELA